MLIREDSGPKETLQTELATYINGILKQTPDEAYTPKEAPPIGDAAVLMAADGYGSGHIKGKRGGQWVVIKTSETIKNFSLPLEHSPQDLFKEAYKVFKKIEEDRHMKH